MAYAALVSLAGTLKQVQNQDQINILFGGEDNAESLHKNIMLLLNFLEGFPVKHAASVRPLEDRMRDAAYKQKDLIETYIILSGMVPPESTHSGKRNSLIQKLEQLVQAVKSFIKCIESILEDATKMKNIYAAEDLSTSAYISSSAPGLSRNAPRGKETMVIVNDDFIQVKDRVTSDELNLQIIPIIGAGGIGKTTLARNVYEDPLIVQHFDVRFWVTVSQEYHVQEVLRGLLPNQGPMGEHVEVLIERVYKSLKNRRYLIVFDDMWHEEVWDRVRRAFPDDDNGSRVIITTRLSDVAKAVDSSSPLYRMQFLNEDQSWALLREKVYGQEHCPQQLEEVGKIIAKNCKGLPLTIGVVSGLLKVNKTERYWDSVATNINKEIARSDNEYFAILSLSYDNLPRHLKACFLYMGMFPEDYRIPVNKLIKLWVVEGFLKPARLKSLEEVAEEYLEDLVDRNLVLITKKRSNGKIRFCGIHDVLRELSVKKGHEEKFSRHCRHGYSAKYPEIPNIQRRLIIHYSPALSLQDDIHNSHVRSLLYFSRCKTRLMSFTSKFLLLIVLDGLEIESECFPDEILDLVNLRYLAFTCDSTLDFPVSISKLKNLETLIFNDNTALSFKLLMPSEIWKMPQLRHLVLNNSGILPIPNREKLGEINSILHNLQTLHVMDFEFKEDVIERLPNLKKLRVKYLCPKPEHWPTYCINNLVNLHQLEELNFEMEEIPFDPNISSFPQNLKKLTLRGCNIPWEKMSIVGSLPKLEVLKLMNESFIGREWEITKEFSSLKHLEMTHIDLEEWIVESNNFPCLERLIIRWCQKLKQVPESIGDIPTLQMSTIKKCNFGVEESATTIQEQQQSLGNDDLTVHIVPMDAYDFHLTTKKLTNKNVFFFGI